jgi:hypothetical protein
VAVFNKKD